MVVRSGDGAPGGWHNLQSRSATIELRRPPQERRIIIEACALDSGDVDNFSMKKRVKATMHSPPQTTVACDSSQVSLAGS